MKWITESEKQRECYEMMRKHRGCSDVERNSESERVFKVLMKTSITVSEIYSQHSLSDKKTGLVWKEGVVSTRSVSDIQRRRFFDVFPILGRMEWSRFRKERVRGR